MKADYRFSWKYAEECGVDGMRMKIHTPRYYEKDAYEPPYFDKKPEFDHFGKKPEYPDYGRKPDYGYDKKQDCFPKKPECPCFHKKPECPHYDRKPCPKYPPCYCPCKQKWPCPFYQPADGILPDGVPIDGPGPFGGPQPV